MSKTEVTREHRMWAISCWEEWPYGSLTPDHTAWLDGLPTLHGDDPYSHLELIAKAIAEAEQRGARKVLSDLCCWYAPEESMSKEEAVRANWSEWPGLLVAIGELGAKLGAKP